MIMKEKIIEILNDMRPEVDFTKESNLVSGGILTSFDVVALVEELSDCFEIDIMPKDLKASNFNSIESIVSLVEKYV